VLTNLLLLSTSVVNPSPTIAQLPTLLRYGNRLRAVYTGGVLSPSPGSLELCARARSHTSLAQVRNPTKGRKR